jgi:hypothetical protein
MDQIEKISFILKSNGSDDDFLWNLIFQLPNLRTLQIQMNFNDLIDAFRLQMIDESNIENLVLDILPFSNYIRDTFYHLSKMKLKQLVINILENPNNECLQSISYIRCEILRLLINRPLTLKEKEFLSKMLTKSFWILEFDVIYLSRFDSRFSYLITMKDILMISKIANMNKIKHQIQSNFKYVYEVPRDIEFHFEIKKYLVLEENSIKKKNLK